MLTRSTSYVPCAQPIEYSLLPLYDPELPLESFMSADQAATFRRVIKAATENAWSASVACEAGCATYCEPVVDFVGKNVSYSCVAAGNLTSTEPAPLDMATFARELSSRIPLSSAMLPIVPAVSLLQVND